MQGAIAASTRERTGGPPATNFQEAVSKSIVRRKSSPLQLFAQAFLIIDQAWRTLSDAAIQIGPSKAHEMPHQELYEYRISNVEVRQGKPL